MASLVLTQPCFAIWQAAFILASFLWVGIGFVTRQLVAVDAIAVVTIPAVALMCAVRVYRRLQAVSSERSTDVSDELLVVMLASMQSTALLALFAIVG